MVTILFFCEHQNVVIRAILFYIFQGTIAHCPCLRAPMFAVDVPCMSVIPLWIMYHTDKIALHALVPKNVICVKFVHFVGNILVVSDAKRQRKSRFPAYHRAAL